MCSPPVGKNRIEKNIGKLKNPKYYEFYQFVEKHTRPVSYPKKHFCEKT
jgi:hypothetical protein